MDQKMKWGLILAGVMAISVLAICGIRYWRNKNLEKEEKKANLKKELDYIVKQASDSAVNTFIESQANEASANSSDVMSSVKTGAAIAVIVKADVDTVINALKEVHTTKKDEITKIDTSVIIADIDSTKQTAAINEKAKQIVKDLMKKKIKDEIGSFSENAAKSATDDQVKKLAEGSSVKDTDKENISNLAKEAASKKVSDIITTAKLTEIKGKVETEGKKDLTTALPVVKTDLISKAIKTKVGIK